jgi:hypothetical protein|tara:strand:- start:43 stop:372 length:330 start_codon:yes stop_codon:yes gene_type:complete
MVKGVVYLITDWSSVPEKYKIGITKNSPNDRLKSLQTGSSGELVLLKTYESYNYRKIESALHRGYKPYSTDGGKEWFELPNEVALNFINECKQIDDNIKFLMESDNPFI